MILTLEYWVLSKVASSTIFWDFGMTRPGIEARSPGLLAFTLLIRPMAWLALEITNIRYLYRFDSGILILKAWNYLSLLLFFYTDNCGIDPRRAIHHSPPLHTNCSLCSKVFKTRFGSFFLSNQICIFLFQ